nr:uracil-DNA glycosylase family protein [Blattabacterium cuenoti]
MDITEINNKGWEIFTDQIVRTISNKKKKIVFLLWGKYAKKKASIINSFNKHYILKTSHPSPFSANLGFFGSKHFLKTNQFLYEIGKKLFFGELIVIEREKIKNVKNDFQNLIMQLL